MDLLIGRAAVLLVFTTGVAAAAPRELTGISDDVRQFRLGKTTICTIAAAEPGGGTSFPPECREVPVREQRALALRAPVARSEVKTSDGRLIVVRIEEIHFGGGAVGCLTVKGGTCPPMPPSTARTMVIEAVDAKGVKTPLVRYGDDVRAIDGLYASEDGTRLIVAFREMPMLREGLPEDPDPFVAGWDLAPALRVQPVHK